MRRLLLIAGVALSVVLAVVLLGAGMLLYTSTGARWVLAQAQDAVPGALRIERVDGSLAGGLHLAGLAYTDAATDLRVAAVEAVVRPGFRPLSLRVQRLELDGVRYRPLDDGQAGAAVKPPSSLALPLRIDIEQFSVDGLAVEDAQGKPVFEADRLQGRLSAFERLDLAQVRIKGPFGRVEARGSFGLASPWPLDFELSGDLQRALGEASDPARVRFTGSLSGLLEDYRVDASGELSGDALGSAHAFELAADGTPAGLDIGRFSLEGPAVKLETRAVLDRLEQRLGVSGLELTVPGSEFTAAADLRVALDSGRVAGDVSWRDFAWPLRDAAPRLRSPSGSARIDGTLEDWRVQAAAALIAEGTPPTELTVRASGGREGLEAEIEEGAMLGGRFAGRLGYSWTGAQPVTAQIRFAGIETGPLAPDWPGRLNGEVSVIGDLEPLSLTVVFERLDGTLRATPLAASGGVTIAGRRFVFDDFQAEAGGSRVTLRGAPDAPEGLDFDLQVVDPGRLLPGAGGRATGRGNVALVEGSPRIEIALEGSDLWWHDARIDRLELRNAPLAPGSLRSRLQLEAAGLDWKGQVLDTLSAELDWDADAQRLHISATSDAYRLDARAAGELARPGSAKHGWRWAGRLTGMALKSGEEILVGLAQPAPLEFDPAQAVVSGACFENADAAARFCLDVTWAEETGAAGTVSLDHFPLDLAARRLGGGLEATQAASGRLEFSAPTGGALAANADIALSPGVLRYVEDPDIALETAAGSIRFELAGGVLSAGHLELPMPGQGGVALDFDLSKVADGAASPIAGKLRIELADLDVLTLLIPAVDRMSGRLEAEFDLAGTAGDPGLEGRIDLSDGAVSNLASGLQISDIQLSGAVSADRQTRLAGRFRAIEGEGRLEALLDLTDLYAPRVSLGVSGESLLLFDTPTLRLSASPDAHLEWRQGEVRIAGRLVIPSALVAPDVIPARAVSESEDVVIVAGRLPERQAEPSSAPVRILGELDVELGPDVVVELPVAEVTVGGETRFSWDGGAVPLGDGAFTIGGEILALGQLLEIAEGKVSFPGVRADNPHLNISAERDIYGNSEVRRAGVLIAGTLRRPLVEPYTEPMTNRERARTLLITGSDFDMERGAGSVDVGTYIAPKIFISYGIGVFDHQSVFSVRYDLGRGWGVKATSGENQTGFDISYTIER